MLGYRVKKRIFGVVVFTTFIVLFYLFLTSLFEYSDSVQQSRKAGITCSIIDF